MFPGRNSLDRLLQETHELSDRISRIDTGMQQLVGSNLAAQRSAYDAYAHNPNATTVSLTTPTNNSVRASGILIVVGTGVGTLQLTLGGRVFPTIPNPSTGIVNLQFQGKGMLLDNTSVITLTSQNAGDLYIEVMGEQVGNAQAIA